MEFTGEVNKKNVVVVGGGASGLMAAYAAAAAGKSVVLLEKNEKLGKKIYITGKGRCNVTNDCTPEEFLAHVVNGNKFLIRSAYRFPPSETMKFFESHGLPLKVERGNRVFPVSDHASDVTKSLERACRDAGVEIRLNEVVCEIVNENGAVRSVRTTARTYDCDAVIVATGGLTYPSTGSTGDGYAFARHAGHTCVPCVPSLVGIELIEDVAVAQGVSLKNVTLTAKRAEKGVYREQGELLFTHYGISGPLVLTLSAIINRIPMRELEFAINFKPALDEETLDQRLLKDFSLRKNEQMKNVMRGLLPAGAVQLVLNASRVSGIKQANAVTKEERRRLLLALKALPLRPKQLRGFQEAVITSGGISLKEVDPSTMESKIVKGLFFCGEVLDCDALTGGFNLQIAFCTGYAAGASA